MSNNSVKLLNYVDLNGDFLKFYTELNSDCKIGDKVFIHGGNYDNTKYTKREHSEYDPFHQFAAGYEVLDIDNTDNSNGITLNIPTTIGSESFTSGGITSLIIDPPTVYLEEPGVNDIKEAFLAKSVFIRGEFNGGEFREGIFGEFKVAENSDTTNPVRKNSAKFNNKFLNSPASFSQGIFLGGDWQWGLWANKYNSDKTGKYQDLNQFGEIKDPNDSSRLNVQTFSNNFNGAGYSIMMSGNVGRCYLGEHFLNITDQKVQFLSLPFELQKAYEFGFSIQIKLKNKYVKVGKNDRIFNVESITKNNVFIKEFNPELNSITTKRTQRLFKELGYYFVEILISDSETKPNEFNGGRFMDSDILAGDFSNMKLLGGVYWNGVFHSGQAISDYNIVTWKGGLFDSTPITGIATDVIWDDGIWINGSWEGASNFRILNIYQNNDKANIEIDHKYLKHFKIGDDIMISYIKSVVGDSYLQSFTDQIDEMFLNMNIFKIEDILYTDDLQNRLRFAVVISATVPNIPLNLQYARISKSNFKRGVWENGDWQTGYKKGELIRFTEILSGTEDSVTLKVENTDKFKYWDWIEVANINLVRQINVSDIIDNETADDRVIQTKTNINTKLRIIDINRYDSTITLDTSFIDDITSSDVFIGYEFINENSYNVIGTSIWENGNFNSGVIEDNIWKDGSFKSVFSDDLGNEDIQAIWRSGYWKDGSWLNGVYLSGIWLNGSWMEGLMTNSFKSQEQNIDNTFALGDSIWYDGVWNDGFWRRGLWKKGTFIDGEIENGGFDKIDLRGGTYLNGLGVFKDKSNGGVLNNRSRSDLTNQSVSAPSVIFVDKDGWIQLDQPSFYQNDYNVIFQDFNYSNIDNVFNNQQFNIINRDKWGTKLKIYHGRDNSLDNPNPPNADQLPLIVINNSVDILEISKGIFWIADRNFQRVIEYDTNTDSLDVIGIVLENPEKQIFDFKRISKMITSENSDWIYFIDDFDSIADNNDTIVEYRWVRVSKDKSQFEILQQTKNTEYVNSINSNLNTSTQTKKIAYKDTWVADDFNNATIQQTDFLLTDSDIVYYRNNEFYTIITNTVNENITDFTIPNIDQYKYFTGVRVKDTDKTDLFLIQGNSIYQLELNFQNSLFVLNSSPTRIYSEPVSDIFYPVSTITVDDAATTIYNTFYFIVTETTLDGPVQRLKRVLISLLEDTITTKILNEENELSYQINNIRLGYQDQRILYNAASTFYPQDSTIIGFSDFTSTLVGFNDPNKKSRLLDLVNTDDNYEYWISDDKGNDVESTVRLIKVDESVPSLYTNAIPVANFIPLKLVFGFNTNTIYFSSINEEGTQYQIQTVDKVSPQPTELASLSEKVLDLVHVPVGNPGYVYYTTPTKLLSYGTPFTFTHNVGYRLITGVAQGTYSLLYGVIGDSVYEINIDPSGTVTTNLLYTIPGIIDITAVFYPGVFTQSIELLILFNTGKVYRLVGESFGPGFNTYSKFIDFDRNDLYLTVNQSFGTNGGEIYRSLQTPERVIIGGGEDNTYYSVLTDYANNITQNVNIFTINNNNIFHYDFITNCIYINNVLTKGRYKQFQNPGLFTYDILGKILALETVGANNLSYLLTSNDNLSSSIVQEVTNTLVGSIIFSYVVDLTATNNKLFALSNSLSRLIWDVDYTFVSSTSAIIGTSISISANDKKITAVEFDGKTLFAVSDGTKIKLIDRATASAGYTLHTGTVKDLQFINTSSTSGVSLYFYDETDTLYVSQNLNASTTGWSYFTPVEIGNSKPIVNINAESFNKINLLDNNNTIYTHLETDLRFDSADLISVANFTNGSNYLLHYTNGSNVVRLEAASGTNGNPRIERTVISTDAVNTSKILTYKNKAVVLSDSGVRVLSKTDNFTLPNPGVISNSSSGLGFDYTATPIDIAVNNDDILVLYNIQSPTGYSAATSGSSYSFIYGYNSSYGTQGSFTGTYYRFTNNPFGGVSLDSFYTGSLLFTNNNIPYVVEVKDGLTTIGKSLVNPFTTDETYTLNRLKDQITSNSYSVMLNGSKYSLLRRTGSAASLTASVVSGTIDESIINVTGGTNGSIQLIGSNTGSFDVFNITIGGNTVNTVPVYLNGTSGSLNNIGFVTGTVAQVSGDTITFTESFEDGPVQLVKLSDIMPTNGTSSFAFGTNGTYSTSSYSSAQATISGFDIGTYGGWVNFVLGEEYKTLLVKSLLDITNSSFTDYTLSYNGNTLIAKTKPSVNHEAVNGKTFAVNRLEQITVGNSTDASKTTGAIYLASTSGAVFNLQLGTETTSGYAVDNILKLKGNFTNFITSINGNTISLDAVKSGSKYNTNSVTVINSWNTVNTPTVTGMISDSVNYQAISNKLALDNTYIYLYDTSTKINKHTINYSAKTVSNTVVNSYNIDHVEDMYSTGGTGTPAVRKYASDPAISIASDGKFFVNLFDGIQQATPLFDTYILNSGHLTKIKLPAIHLPVTQKTISVGGTLSNDRLEHNLKNLDDYTIARTFDVELLVSGYKRKDQSSNSLDNVNSPYITGRVMYNLNLTGDVDFNQGGTPYTAHIVSSVWDPYISEDNTGLFIGSWDTPKYIDYKYNVKDSRFLNGIFQGEWHDGIFQGGTFNNFDVNTPSYFREGLVLSDNSNVSFVSGKIETDLSSRRNDVKYVEVDLETNRLVVHINALRSIGTAYEENTPSPLETADIIRIPGLFKEEKITIHEVRKISYNPNGVEELMLVCDLPSWLDVTIDVETMWLNHNIFISGLNSTQVPGENTYINRLYIELFGEQKVTNVFTLNNKLYVTVQCDNSLDEAVYVFPEGKKPFIWLNQIFRIKDKRNLNESKSQLEILLEYPSPVFTNVLDKLNWIKGALILDAIPVEYSGTSGSSVLLNTSQNKSVVYAPQYVQVFKTNFVQTNYPVNISVDGTIRNTSFKDINGSGVIIANATVVAEDVIIENSDITSLHNFQLRGAVSPASPTLLGELNNVIFMSGETDLNFKNGIWLNLDERGFSNGESKFKPVTYSRFVPTTNSYVDDKLYSTFSGVNYLLLNSRVSYTNDTLTLNIISATNPLLKKNQYITLRGFSGDNSYLLGAGRSRVFRLAENSTYVSSTKTATVKVKIPKPVNVTVDEEEMVLFLNQLTVKAEQDITDFTQIKADTSGKAVTHRFSAAYLSNNAFNGGDFEGNFNGIWNGGNFNAGNFGSTSGLVAQWFSDTESYYWGGLVETLKTTNDNNYTITLDLTGKPFEPGDLIYVRFNDYLRAESFYAKVNADNTVTGTTLNNFDEGEYGVNIIRYKRNNNLFLNQNLSLGPESNIAYHTLASDSHGTNGGWNEAETYIISIGTEDPVWDIDSASRDSVFYGGNFMSDIFRAGVMKGGQNPVKLVWKYGVNDGAILNNTLWLGGFNNGGIHNNTEWVRGKWYNGEWRKGNWYSLDQGLYYNLPYSKWTGGIWYSRNTSNYLNDNEGFNTANNTLVKTNYQLNTENSVWYGGIWESPVVNDVNGNPKTYSWDSDFIEQFSVQVGNTTKDEPVLLPRTNSMWLGGQWYRGEFRGGIFYGGIWHSKSLTIKERYIGINATDFPEVELTPGRTSVTVNLYRNVAAIFAPAFAFGHVIVATLPLGSRTTNNAVSVALRTICDTLITKNYPATFSCEYDSNGTPVNGQLVFKNMIYNDKFIVLRAATFLDSTTILADLKPYEMLAYDINQSKFKGGKFINSVWLGGTVEDTVDPKEIIFGDNLGDNVRVVSDDSLFNNESIQFNESLITKAQKVNGITLFNNQANLTTIWKSLKNVPLNSVYSAVWTRGIWKNGVFKHSSWYNLNTDVFVDSPVSKFNSPSEFRKGLFFGSVWDGGLWVANNGATVQNGIITNNKIISAFSQSRWKKGYWTTDTNTSIISNAGDETEISNSTFWRSVWDMGIFEGGVFDMSVWRSGYVHNDVPAIKYSATSGTAGTSGLDAVYLQYVRKNVKVEYDLDTISGTSGLNNTSGASKTRSYDVLSVMDSMRILNSNNVITADYYNPALAYNWTFNVTDRTGTRNIAQTAMINVNSQKFDGTYGTSGLALISLTTQDLSLLNPYRFTGGIDNFASVFVNGLMRGSIWHGGVWMRGMFLHKEADNKDFFGQEPVTDLGTVNEEYQKYNLGFWFRGIWLSGYFGYYNDTKVQDALDWISYMDTYNTPRNRSFFMSMDPFTLTSDMDPSSISGFRAPITLTNIYNNKPFNSIFTRAGKKLSTGKGFHSVFNGHMLGGSILDNDKVDRKVLLSAFSIIGDVFAAGSSTSGSFMDPNTNLNFKLRNATTVDLTTVLPVPLELNRLTNTYKYYNTIPGSSLNTNINYGNSFNYTFRHNNAKYGDGTPTNELPSLAQGSVEYFHLNEPAGEPFHSTSGVVDFSNAVTVSSITYVQNVSNNDLILLIELNNYDLTTGSVNKVTISPNPITGTGSLVINAGVDPNGIIQETTYIYGATDIITNDATQFVARVYKPLLSNLIIGSSYFIAIELS